MGRADGAHRGGAAVLLVVGVEDEQHVEGLGQRGVRLVAGLGHLPHHRQEVLGEAQRVVRVDERHPDAEAVAGRGQRGHLGDEPDDLAHAVLGIEDVLGVGVEGRERGDGRHEHPHRVGVVVEALEEALAHVLVDERVVRDVVDPRLVLRGGRQLAVDQQVGHLEVGRVLRQLLDRVAAVAEDARVAVEVGDRARRGGRRHQRRVVEPDPRAAACARRWSRRRRRRSGSRPSRPCGCR